MQQTIAKTIALFNKNHNDHRVAKDEDNILSGYLHMAPYCDNMALWPRLAYRIHGGKDFETSRGDWSKGISHLFKAI